MAESTMTTRHLWLRCAAHLAILGQSGAFIAACSSDAPGGPSETGTTDASTDSSAAVDSSRMDSSVVGQVDSSGPQVEAGARDAPEGGADGDATGSSDAPVTDAPSDAVVGTDGEPLDSSGDAGGPAPVPPAPPLLSATGLFKSIAANGTLVLADGVQEYQPKYALWSDGDKKDRWVFLPPGTKIDTTDLDHWSFPVGTKFWKEFAINGKRVETRLLWRYGPSGNDFLYVTYWWNPEAGIANDAELTDPDNGAQAVNGTTHDIPTQQNCHTCHDSLEEHVLGFGAIELNHTLPGANIHTLIQAGLLTNNPNVTDLDIPGDTTAQVALGYLHANCGNCHNNAPGASGVPQPSMNLRVLVGSKTVQATDTYKTAVNVQTTDFTLIKYRIAGQDPINSCVTHDMVTRGAREQMPPLASKDVDDAGVASVNAWIMALPKAP
jgi:hypothetical protein